MGDVYARVLEQSTLKCAPVKSSNRISLPWRGYARLTGIHTYAHMHKDIGRHSLGGDESLRCVLWAVAPYSSFQKLPSRLNQSYHTLWRWKRPTLLSVGCKRGRRWPSYLGRARAHTHTQWELWLKEDKTNIWTFTWQLWTSTLLRRGLRPPWIHFIWLGEFLTCSAIFVLTPMKNVLKWMIDTTGQDGWLVSQYFFSQL